MSSLYNQIVRDIEDEDTRQEIIRSLTHFSSKIKKEDVEILREKVNRKFKGKNVPRKLSEEQITAIVDFSVPKVPATIDIISTDNNNQIKEFIKTELRERKIVINTDNIEKLKNEIRETYYRSLVSPGDSVGVEVAMSFGQPLTQMNLDTFHSAGTSSDLGSGVKSLNELFNVSENRKKNLTTIHFKDKNLTREEIHIQGKALKGISIKSLLESSEVLNIDGRKNLGEDSLWYDNYLNMFPIETELKEAVFTGPDITEEMLENIARYHRVENQENGYIENDGSLIVVFDPLITTSSSIVSELDNLELSHIRAHLKIDNFLRLKFNSTKCYNLGISMNDILSSLKDETIIPVVSPLSIGIIDLHPNEDYIQESINDFITTGKIEYNSCKKRKGKIKTPVEFDQTNMTQSKILFLTVIIENCLEEIFIKGIKGINNIIPMSENIIASIKTQKVTDIDILIKHQEDNLWYMGINYMKLKYTGIPPEKIIGLCDNAHIKIIENNIFHNGKFSKHPHLIVNTKTDPKEIINDKFDIADKYVKNQVKNMSKSEIETDYELPDYPEIYRNSSYNYAYAEGEKIVRKLMRHIKLDNKLILPNNPNEIYEIFGIESARLYMVREYVNLIETSGSYVTPVNIELLVDYQTVMGFLTPIHAIGASKQGTSSLSAATFHDPVGTFQKAASIGKTDKINSVSSCIMAGKKCINGSGLSIISFENKDESFFDEMPREFDKTEEFCEQRYVINDKDVDEKEPVDINIERLMEKEKKEELKFSTEQIPSIVTSMEAPDFLSDDIEETKPEEVEVMEPIVLPHQTPDIIEPIMEDSDSDFDIPDEPQEIAELKDF